MSLRTGHLLTPARLSLCAVGVAAMTLLAACGGSDATTSAPAAGTGGGDAVVRTDAGPDGRMILVDTEGKTLYASDQEGPGDAIQCTGSCLGFWFPLTVKGATPRGDGVPADKLGTTKRPDNGQTQVTFDGRPLYTFKLDTSSGMTKGDGLTDDFDGTTFDWHAATVDGVSSDAPDSGGAGGGGYGY
jgi:predicted lipoprotein with Yx(FWY)xxD motif